MTNIEAKKLIKEIGADCYKMVQQWTQENWRKPIPDPVDTYINYDNTYTNEIKELIDSGHEGELLAYLEEAAQTATEATKV